jgi:hypothetical protein
LQPTKKNVFISCTEAGWLAHASTLRACVQSAPPSARAWLASLSWYDATAPEPCFSARARAVETMELHGDGLLLFTLAGSAISKLLAAQLVAAGQVVSARVRGAIVTDLDGGAPGGDRGAGSAALFFAVPVKSALVAPLLIATSLSRESFRYGDVRPCSPVDATLAALADRVGAGSSIFRYFLAAALGDKAGEAWELREAGANSLVREGGVPAWASIRALGAALPPDLPVCATRPLVFIGTGSGGAANLENALIAVGTGGFLGGKNVGGEVFAERDILLTGCPEPGCRDVYTKHKVSVSWLHLYPNPIVQIFHSTTVRSCSGTCAGTWRRYLSGRMTQAVKEEATRQFVVRELKEGRSCRGRHAVTGALPDKYCSCTAGSKTCQFCRSAEGKAARRAMEAADAELLK